MSKTYHKQTAAFLGKIGECMPELSSEVMQQYIENPFLLKGLLSGLPILPRFAHECSPWMDMRLGISTLSIEAWLKDFEKEGLGVASWTRDIFKQLTLEDSDQGDAEVFILTVADLGFPCGGCIDDLYAKAIKLGFRLCSLEVVFSTFLRTAGNTVPDFNFAMTSVQYPEGENSIFSFESHRNGNYLVTHKITGGKWCDRNSRWLFTYYR